MLNKGNLRDRLARQSGSTPAGASPSKAGAGGQDAGLNKLIEAERAKREATAAGESGSAKSDGGKKNLPTNLGPASQKSRSTKGSGKSTTNQGLR